MHEQIDTPTKTEQTADNSPLTDAELNSVSGAEVHIWRSVGAGTPLWPLTQNIKEAVWFNGSDFHVTFQPFAVMK